MQLITMLSSKSRRYTIDEIAKKMDGSDGQVSKRTAYRYIESLKTAGYFVDCNDGYYHFVEDSPLSTTVSKYLNFSDEEIGSINEIIDSFDKEATYKRELRRKLISALSVASSIVDTEKAQLIKEAIKTKKQVILKDYSSGSSSNPPSDRQVEPFQIMDNDTKVWCFDPKDGMTKIFKLSHAKKVKLTLTPSANANKYSPKPIDIFRMTGSINCHVKLRLSNFAKNVLLDDYPLSVKYIADEKNNDKFPYKADIPIYNFEGVTRFVVSMGENIEIYDSPEFLSYLKTFIHKSFDRYL